jgi:RimJ/RimL family protein N-acetyltransferase
MTGQEEILRRCRETFGDADGAWFMEMGNLRKLDGILHEYGYEIRMVHPFYIPGTDLTETERQAGPADTPEISLDDGSSCRIVWYRGEEIEQFRGDDRFPEAYSFCETAPDVIGTAAVQDGRILGMAGASADSPLMWQIGINVEPFARGKGIAARLVTLMKEEILRQGALPYYGTAVSHIASQRVALRAGFVPAWTELVTRKIPSGDDSSARITP